MSATAISPTNLALIKYWGKRDSVLNLPINSSLSVTLDQNDLQTVTTARFGNARDRLWVNGEEVSLDSVPRTVTVLKEMRGLLSDNDDRKSKPIHIESKNSFPTAAGLASSAAGYSAMVTAIAGLFGLDFEARKQELSRIARRGSGSACRSLMGGIVAWHMGLSADGSDSQAEQICEPSHWSNLEAIICVASDKKKHVSSTSGMQTSVKTSDLLSYRASNVVPNRFRTMRDAIMSRKDSTVFELTMKESNQFHACCLDTYPPIFYMTDVSRAVVRAVDGLNGSEHPPKFAYTFDAGPNAVIFCNKENTKELLDALLQSFPPSQAELRKDPDFQYVRGRTTMTRAEAEASRTSGHVDTSGDLLYIFHTGIGQGARILKGQEEKIYQLTTFENVE